MRIVRGLLLAPALKLLNWLLKRDGNSVIIGGPLGWTWENTIDDAHHGSLGSGLHADSHDRLHDHSLADDGSPIAVEGVPNLPASKITSGTFALAQIPTPLTGKDADTVDGFGGPDATNPVTQAFGDSPSPGTATVMPRRDHRHGMPANPVTDNIKTVSITFIIDGGGAAITTGSKGYLEIPFNCTITGWTILADKSGSIVVDVKKCTYSAFPTTSSIAGSEKPTLSSAQKAQDLSLTTWTTSIANGDILEFVVDSVATVTRVTLSIRATRT